MTVAELFEQAKNLSPEEQQQLAQMLLAAQEPTWSDDELEALMTIEPMTGREIVEAGLTGGWQDLDISDGAAWVTEQCRKRRERRKW